MGPLTSEQVLELRDYLETHGLTFESLQEEMLDHICSDVENYMMKGLSFEHAIKKVKSEIPKNQFKKIQTETMEAINKRIRPTNFLAYTTLILLVMATIFKLLHWPGAGKILIGAFIFIAITMISAFFTNILIKEKERGKMILIAFSITIIMFLTSLCFQLLHLPGTIFLRQGSVISSILLLSGYAIYSYFNPQKTANHILMEYVRKEGFNIEKSLIVLSIFGVGLKLWQNDFLYVVFFMLVFSIGSSFYFIRSWQYYANKRVRSEDKFGLLLISILAYTMFMLPTIRAIGEPTRIVMVWSSIAIMLLGISIHYFKNSQDSYRLILGFFSLMIMALVFLNLVAKSNLLNPGTTHYVLDLVYSPISFISLIILFGVFFKRPAFRAVLLITLGMWFFSWQMPGI
ncbi:hypothetical protein FNH22_19810 [Fulvivirga sp. M361]|uniref:hypothetical protein n=1 Tax=Fulvivirga sp. M361 TaxID=2594266 RepID=UPI00118F60FD|nr:hypothetical protein [Fulvivirga sp. M361]TRX54362.1 hypothetical protein FNH22_19810 [Fulvivirga sp. M361]